MNLIPPEFGLRTTDPTIPPLKWRGYTWTLNNEHTIATWHAWLPWQADHCTHRLPNQWRADATIEHAETAATIEPPWDIRIRISAAGVGLQVRLTGPDGWEHQVSPADRYALDARADVIATTGWAAWHATGQADTTDEISGILWLVGAGFDWGSAVTVALMLAAA